MKTETERATGPTAATVAAANWQLNTVTPVKTAMVLDWRTTERATTTRTWAPSSARIQITQWAHSAIVASPGMVMSYNRYMYTLGNPLKYNDPSGHICVPILNVGNTCSDPTLVDTGIQLVVSLAAGDVNDIFTVATGYDYISGQEVAYFSGEWWATGGAMLLPVVAGSTVKSAVKTLDKVDDVLGTGVGKKIDDLVSQADCLINSFSAETLVMTARGLRPISELIEGDLVLAWDEATGKNGYFVVTDTISHLDASIVLLTLSAPELVEGGETLETTADHPFYVVDENAWFPLSTQGEWVEAGELQIGDAILQADGETGRVVAVRVVPMQQRMYNLTVERAHTFFVGEGQWLVHNCGPSLKLDSTQFGNKAGQHARDYGLDPSKVADRDWLEKHIVDIAGNPDEVRQGSWRGGSTDNFFFLKGNDVVVTKADGTFVTILKDAISNRWFSGATKVSN